MPPNPIEPSPIIQPPSPKQQSWGAIISIVIIVIMVIIGAFYAWGERISENNNLPAESITP